MSEGSRLCRNVLKLSPLHFSITSHSEVSPVTHFSLLNLSVGLRQILRMFGENPMDFSL